MTSFPHSSNSALRISRRCTQHVHAAATPKLNTPHTERGLSANDTGRKGRGEFDRRQVMRFELSSNLKLVIAEQGKLGLHTSIDSVIWVLHQSRRHTPNRSDGRWRFMVDIVAQGSHRMASSVLLTYGRARWSWSRLSTAIRLAYRSQIPA